MLHLSVKIFAQPGAQLPASDAITVFHRWIQKGDMPDLLIDVADYAHVPAGPGIVLMGHQAAYSLDNSGNRLGLLYNRRVADDLSFQQAYDNALAACKRLEAEPEFQSKLKFNPREFSLIWNDRMLYPNTDASWAAVRPAVEAFLTERFGANYKLTRSTEIRTRLRAEVRV